MKVKELINVLQELDPEEDLFLWDDRYMEALPVLGLGQFLDGHLNKEDKRWFVMWEEMQNLRR